MNLQTGQDRVNLGPSNERRLADAASEANRKSKTIETFLAGEGDEMHIAVKNVALDDLREQRDRRNTRSRRLRIGQPNSHP